MYLTCVTMDRAHPSTRQALADCCDMHRNISVCHVLMRREEAPCT